jgi:putative flippase GtrA
VRRLMAVDVFTLLPRRLRTPRVEKLLKYSLGSAVGVVTDAVVLFMGAELLGMDKFNAHLLAVGVATVPNYTINRYWTWQQSGKNRLWGEVMPFWVMAFLGFAMSSLFVAYAKEEWDTTLAVLAANLAGFGVVWPLKFLVLDKLMWKVVPDLDLDEEAGTGDTVPAPVEP